MIKKLQADTARYADYEPLVDCNLQDERLALEFSVLSDGTLYQIKARLHDATVVTIQYRASEANPHISALADIEERLRTLWDFLTKYREQILESFPHIKLAWHMHRITLAADIATAANFRQTGSLSVRVVLESYDLEKREKPSGEGGVAANFVVPTIGAKRLYHRFSVNGQHTDWMRQAKGRSFNCVMEFSLIYPNGAEMPNSTKTFYATTPTSDGATSLVVLDSMNDHTQWIVEFTFAPLTPKVARLESMSILHSSDNHPELIDYMVRFAQASQRLTVLAIADSAISYGDRQSTSTTMTTRKRHRSTESE